MTYQRLTPHAAGGFMLIELMIVVAIVGVLSSMAISSYQEYTVRAKMMEVVTLARRDLDLLREYFHLYGAIPADPTLTGVDLSAARSDFLSADTTVDWNGVQAVVTYSVEIGSDASGSLLYTGIPVGSDLSFSCSTPDLEPRYIPQNCR